MPIQEQQLNNKQHAVPQNIMQVEFKLIGELTMRQFVYVAVFAVAAYMAKLSVPQPFTWFFVIGLALTGLALAFVPFEERGLDEWIVNFLTAISSPTERIWRKEAEVPSVFAYEQNLRFVQQEMITLAPTASRRKLEEFLHQRKTQVDDDDYLDIPEQEYIDKVREAFKDVEEVSEEGFEGETMESSVKVTHEMEQEELEMQEMQEHSDQPEQGELEEKPEIEQEVPQSQEEELKEEQLPQESPVEKVQEEEKVQAAEVLQEASQQEPPAIEKAKATVQQVQTKTPSAAASKTQESQKTKQQAEKQDKMSKLIQSRLKKSRLKPLDEGKSGQAQLRPVSTHSGRKFVNLTPGQGEIILPIRGEKVLPTVEETERQLSEKTKKLQQLLDKDGKDDGAKDGKKLHVRKIPSLVQRPNVLSGVVKNRKDEYLENVVVVVKNEEGEPVRALKTDKLGKFLISSPLPNGNYKIEVDKTNETSLSFDIIPFKVEGGVLPSYEIIGR
ncbi:hypothetical protein GF360_01160 [candidate division WWE3 bacterium]|nr:hypothetical protein [candidate division WWE3 bacterium]